MNEALRPTIPGAMAFASHTCVDASRRRRRLLQASSVTVTTDATVRDAAYGDDASKSDIAGGAQSAVTESSASGTLGAAIANAAAALDPTSPLRAVTLSATLPPTPMPTTPAPTTGDEDEGAAISPSLVFTGVSVALGVVVILVGVAFYHHKERKNLSPVTVLFLIFSAPDFVLDCMWVHERQLSPGEQAFYVCSLTILVFTSIVNTISTLLAINHEIKRKQFDADKFFETCYGAPYMLILLLCCTNTDGLLLLPWTYDEEFKKTRIFEQTGFPSELLLKISFLRLIEDAGQAIIQTVYISTRGDAGLLTMLSLITSWLGFLYLLLFKALVWITSARGEIKNAESGIEMVASSDEAPIPRALPAAALDEAAASHDDVSEVEVDVVEAPVEAAASHALVEVADVEADVAEAVFEAPAPAVFDHEAPAPAVAADAERQGGVR